MKEKNARKRLKFLKPIVNGCSLSLSRIGQDALGLMIAAKKRKRVAIRTEKIQDMTCVWATPKKGVSQKVILYIHGGGYVAGGAEYAKGFSSVLADLHGIPVFSPAYRLAPEHPYPAQLEDAFSAYKHLLSIGFKGEDILLCGESAGGALLFSLCFALCEASLPLPAGLIPISPWTDLTASGDSYQTNEDIDPSITRRKLDYYISCLGENIDIRAPHLSPLFGNLAGFPPVLMYVGGDEIMLDDSVLMHQALVKAGVSSELVVKPGMFHAYLLYQLKEHKMDNEKMKEFAIKVLYEKEKIAVDET